MSYGRSDWMTLGPNHLHKLAVWLRILIARLGPRVFRPLHLQVVKLTRVSLQYTEKPDKVLFDFHTQTSTAKQHHAKSEPT